MGFRRGEGNEKLLICVACDNPMALDAEYCSECGAKRSVATGYEKIENTILPNEVEQISAKVKPQVISSKAPELRLKLGRELLRFNQVLIRKKRAILFSTAGMFAIMSYVMVQTIIFSTQSTEPISQQYIGIVSSRDANAIISNPQLFPNPKNLPILPAKFQEWQEVGQISWKTQSQWNGWLGEATINFVPEINGKLNYLKQISLKLRANYKTKAFVFREIDWTVSTSVATIKPDNNLESDQKIYLNNIEVGVSGSEVLNSAEYALLPGPYVFMATGKGFTKQRVNTFFVNSTGENISEFEPISFELSSTQKNSVESQVEKALSDCLKKKCSDLPRLSQWDFEFSNQPTTYLYTDYFIYSWGSDFQCQPAEYLTYSENSASITMDCTATASASVKWMLYRLFLTTYYDLGYDYSSFDLTITADLNPIANSDSVKVTNIQISD